MRKITVGAIVAAAALGAAFTQQAVAWDDLPCGDTEETAHVCAPGEVARNGTIPTPLPTPLPPPPTTLPTPEVTPTPTPALAIPGTTPKPKRPTVHRPGRRHHKTPRTCGELRRAGAGPGSYAARGHYYRCKAPVQHPIPHVAVTGEYRANALGSGTVVSVTRPTTGSYRAGGTLARAGRIPGPVHSATLYLREDGRDLISTTLTLGRRDTTVSGNVSAGCTPRRSGPLHSWRAVLAIHGGPTIKSAAVASRCV